LFKEHFVLRLTEREVVALKRVLSPFCGFTTDSTTKVDDLPLIRTMFARLELLPVIEPLQEAKVG